MIGENSVIEPQQSSESEFTNESILIKEEIDSRGRNVYRFEDLARNNAQVVVIVLADSEYELRRTKAGRLVLNK